MRTKITIDDFKSALAGRTPGPMGSPYRYFSVLAPLVDQDGELHILFETRSDELRRQPGEAGFPGGRVEPGETPLACALRETEEELGVSRESIDVIGELDHINTYGDSTLYCFLGAIPPEAYAAMLPSPGEVKDTFLAPVSFFLENEPEIHKYSLVPRVGDDFPYDKIQPKGPYKWFTGTVIVPIYSFEGRSIWGMTARMTWNLMKLLKEPGVL
jgi:8-oxo-dGTP pyrophosphatase MutT (NUDIX family)